MSDRISFALVIHNHQPVGNFGWVFAEVFDLAYAPLVNALERYPSVRVSLHYSGPLLEGLRAERPIFVERLRDLVTSGQVEILGGGWAEPVLAALAERDRVGQLTRMGDELEAVFGRRPRLSSATLIASTSAVVSLSIGLSPNRGTRWMRCIYSRVFSQTCWRPRSRCAGAASRRRRRQ